ncbi:aspartate ammonia-lyase [Candidatus Methylomirabilis lanthanidiphila]|uniref:Aspartate ammonia-lyase n=1 Tax=Candidatus Methylomirabilis lanthanidiphila TaxID=2211376 RepID=A0A564ZLK3_9BACT|nr:aspartate ammonia-lyase [Candidatus Methylomirabilis lanthanidiphila]VUZ86219.1 aspartate ammonia-lyase [Candidatus Methylomirabilis lanthanidiphila]
MAMRTEKDVLGEKEVPADAYYGIQSVRAMENFPISGLRMHSRMVEAIVLVKKAAAMVNTDVGLLKPEISRVITVAADVVLAGKLRDQFVVDVYQMGAGTSFNMNVNEVLANLAIELLGGQKGDYAMVHPHDHVNMSQSTNDVFPTAMRMAARLLLAELLPVLNDLKTAMTEKAEEFDDILKSGRTHLQDAVPIRLGQEFSAYAATIGKCQERIAAAARSLEELGIGGSASGTGLNTHPQYRARLLEYLRAWTGIEWATAPDMREAMQSNLPIAETSSALRLLALELIRICNDLRLLASGPTTGFAEIVLPAVQPGSSIMPGKVNPSMAEMLNMVCFQVIGNDLTVSMAVQAGQLELNVMMPVMAYNLHQSIEILTNALRVFIDRCVGGIIADADRCRRYAESSMALAAALNISLGYARAAEVVKRAVRERKTIIEVVRDEKLLTEAQIAQILDPVKLTEPGLPGKPDTSR